jgi:NADPH-dependent 2,4-dienoyl-CoA reductase/sulfur reductase-like enzyme/nitrite reductase/ring-hydroxylating ferredoxin subunit
VASDAELTGPDLRAGVSEEAVPEGGMLLGHAGGEAVLLARVDGQLHAIGATCTHYSGPLAEGILVGDTVRCPLHHACFSLRTGEALRAPALDPVPCFVIERQEGRVRVGEKQAAVPTRPAVARPESVVIVGAGAAGAAAAEMLRREGYDGPIVLLSSEPHPPVDRPNLSKDYLSGDAPEAWVTLRPAEFYAERRIELRTGVTATALDVKARTVTVDGQPLRYGALILATGAEPVRLDIPGAELPHVHYLRTLADSRAIIAAAEKAGRAVVVGASFIGLEVAAALRKRKLEVTVVAPDRLPLERVMGPEIGAFIRTLHEEHGVRFHLGARPARIERDKVTLDSGESLAADLVVVGVGVRPRTQLAESAGLAVDRGVLVNEYLQTSAADVYAAGDIARWPDARSGGRIRVEHWVVAERQGQLAACNIVRQASGRDRGRFDSVPFFWSAHYDVSIRYVGYAERWARIVIDGELAARDATALFNADGRTLAAASVGRDRQNLQLEAAMEGRGS